MYLIEFLASVSRILSSGQARCGEGKQSKSSKLVVQESVGRQSDQYPSSAEILLGNSGNRVSQEAVARGSGPANLVTCTTRGSDWTRILTVYWDGVQGPATSRKPSKEIVSHATQRNLVMLGWSGLQRTRIVLTLTWGDSLDFLGLSSG